MVFPESVRVTKLYPTPVPDLFKGGQLVLAGRYSGKGDGAVRVEGLVGGDVRKFAYDVKFPEKSEDHEFIPRLWATRRVGYLLDEIRLRGENAELKDEVVEHEEEDMSPITNSGWGPHQATHHQYRRARKGRLSQLTTDYHGSSRI